MKLQAGKRASKWLVYQKIVFIFILLLIPLISTNIWLNHEGKSITKTTILNASTAGASFYSKQLDKEIYFIRNLQLELLYDENLQKLSFRGNILEDYEEVELIDQVMDRLTTLVASSEYVANAGVYVEAVHKTISTMTGVTNTPNAEIALIKSLAAVKPKPSIYVSGDRLFLILNENGSDVWSYVEIAKPRLLETITEIANLYPGSEVLLGSQEMGAVLTTAENDQVSTELLNMTDASARAIETTSGIQKMNRINYFVNRSNIGSMQLSLMMYIDQSDITRSLSRFSAWFYILFFMAVIIVLLYSFSINFMIHRPLSKLVKAFHMIEADNLNIMIESKTRDEFHYVFNGFNHMAHRMKKSIEENYEQKIALQHSQFKQLQAQINPHFLYNCFFNIHIMCKTGDADGAAALSQKLGSYYRYITRSGMDEVPFEQEYRHALDYCDIQCIRFSNRITYRSTDIADIPKSFTVPRLIIQPIVENAFEHAFEDGTTEGMVYIRTEYQGGRLQVTVEDNGTLLSDEAIERLRKKIALDSRYMEKTGLINVNNRLQLAYAPGSGLFVSRSMYGGLKVDVVINAENGRA